MSIVDLSYITEEGGKKHRKSRPTCSLCIRFTLIALLIILLVVATTTTIFFLLDSAEIHPDENGNNTTTPLPPPTTTTTTTPRPTTTTTTTTTPRPTTTTTTTTTPRPTTTTTTTTTPRPTTTTTTTTTPRPTTTTTTTNPPPRPTTTTTTTTTPRPTTTTTTTTTPRPTTTTTTTTTTPRPTTTTTTTTTTTKPPPPPTFTVMISIDNGERYCGGSLIKKDRVLTTQKCCIGAETFSIFIGGIDEPRRPIGKSTKCKNHDSSNIDDGVCVIHLDAPVSGERFTTIRLPSSSQCSETFEGNKATITAWSRTLNDDPSDTRLIHTDVIVNEKKVCKWANPELSTEGTMCTRDTKEPDDCGGYAGDPLTITDTDGEETQIGIASFGPHTKADCYREIGSPDGFVRITSYQYLINIWSD